jgi:hypothetical protein
MTFASLTQALTSHATRRLIAMLRTCRPHGSRAEHAFIERFLLPYGVEADGFGNLWLRIGTAPVLWSSHVDTCHRKEGQQDIAIDETGIIGLAGASKSNCLGADCAAGVWLMTEMIEAGVQGLYVFHRGEERGGLGSRYIAGTEPARLEGIRSAIAFDRRDVQSIITHQGGERCCSDSFASSLAAILGLGHHLDPTGTFTDTANYTDLVGECTNVSVGYLAEHTPHESLDLGYLLQLRDAMLEADWSRLDLTRKPGEIDPDLADPTSAVASAREMYDLVRRYPDAVAEFLDLNGISALELAEFIDADIPF